jgi:ATP-dependent DNA helicase PIF1
MSVLEIKRMLKMSQEFSSIKLKPKQEEAYSALAKGESIFLTGPAGTGKCLGFNTPIIMFDGSIKMVQDIKDGDLIMGDDSTSRKVLSTVTGEDEMYKVTNRYGDSYVVNSVHILTFKVDKIITFSKGSCTLSWGDKCGEVSYKIFNDYEEAKNSALILPDFVDLPISHCIKRHKNRNWSKYFKGVYAKLDFPEKELEIYPYIFGVNISKTICQDAKLTKLLGQPSHMNIMNNKYIPLKYKTGSRQQRLDLIAGLIDESGCLTNENTYEISQTYKQLNEDIYFIAKSLGFYVFKREDNRNGVLVYRIYISGNISEIPVIRTKKPNPLNIDKKYTHLSSSIKIEACARAEYYGFEIDGNHRFVLGNFIITHNTAVIKMFMKAYQNSRNMAVTSTTGTSALLLNGTTIHSYLGIGYGAGSVNSMVEKIVSWPWLRKRWNELECLFVDEISMLDPELFDKIEEIARIVRRNKSPFGGIQIVLSGDFLQLPCVGTDNFCFEAKCWNNCIKHTVYLNEIMRQGDNTFQDVLNKVRVGIIDKQVKTVLNSRIGITLKNEYDIKPTCLFSKNCDVDRINDTELDNLAEDGRQFYEYKMEIVVYPGVSNKSAALEKFHKYCTAPTTLQICKGAQVMLLKNLDIQNGLANGSRGVITGFISDIPLVKFLNGEERLIDQNIWEVEENDKKILRAQQIPLKVAYAISIHKSQGCSLDYAEIDLSDIFEYGQAYVALSRVKSLEGLSIIDIDYDHIKAHPKATAYYESLL